MEQIQTHEIKDIYRIKNGLLVEISKYRSIGHHIHSKRSEKRVRGCKGLTILTEEYTDSYYKKIFPKGTLFYHGMPVEPLTDVNEFEIEIKSSGGSISGDFDETRKIMMAIEDVLSKYKTV